MADELRAAAARERQQASAQTRAEVERGTEACEARFLEMQREMLETMRGVEARALPSEAAAREAAGHPRQLTELRAAVEVRRPPARRDAPHEERYHGTYNIRNIVSENMLARSLAKKRHSWRISR